MHNIESETGERFAHKFTISMTVFGWEEWNVKRLDRILNGTIYREHNKTTKWEKERKICCKLIVTRLVFVNEIPNLQTENTRVDWSPNQNAVISEQYLWYYPIVSYIFFLEQFLKNFIQFLHSLAPVELLLNCQATQRLLLFNVNKTKHFYAIRLILLLLRVWFWPFRASHYNDDLLSSDMIATRDDAISSNVIKFYLTMFNIYWLFQWNRIFFHTYSFNRNMHAA